MGKYELTISKNYVPDWGVKEAIRELFQNALDQETTTPDNSMFFAYDEDNEILEIGNKHSVLEPSSLLLGQTSKLSDELTIGQFGEGYKLAMLILLRNDINIIFYNYGRKEVWKPRFVKSRRYNQDILTVFTEKHLWSKEPDNSLIIRIEGIDTEAYNEIVETNLHLKGVDKCKECGEYGRILEDEDLKGKIFVNGLYVTDYSPLEYGYDFKPKVLKLKRDRSMVDSFDMKRVTAKMWGLLKEDDNSKSEIVRMVVNNVSDLSMVEYGYGKIKDNISKDVYDVFKEQNGENAIAISDNTQIDTFMEEHPDSKPVVVSSQMLDIIKGDERHHKDIEKYYKEIDRTPLEKLELWFIKLKEDNYIGSELESEFEEIFKLLS